MAHAAHGSNPNRHDRTTGIRLPLHDERLKTITGMATALLYES